MNILWYPVIIPVIAGAVILLIPNALKGAREFVALLAAVIAAWWAGTIFFEGGVLVSSCRWFGVDGFVISGDLRADTLSGLVLFAASVFTLLIVIYSIGFMNGRERLKEYYCYVLWTSGFAAAAMLADSLILLLMAWEITTVLLFLLVTIGDSGNRDAAGKTFVMIGFSDSALLLGIILLWYKYGLINISGITGVETGGAYMTSVYILLLVGALVKAGAIPGHTWIPSAAEYAPASVMAYLPASLDKLLGIYLLARISLDMFTLHGSLKMLLLIIGAVTIILAVMMALVQHNLKKLLAFHTVSQVGYMVMGIGTGVPIGIVGGLFHMMNNAIYKSCLFLGAGAVEKRTGTSDLESLGGLSKAMPVTFVAMLIASLSISGVPPFNGFVSKWMVYQGTIEMGGSVFLVAAMFGSALTLASFIKVMHSVFLGKRPDQHKMVKPAGFAMALPMVVLAFFCVLFGVVAQFPLRHLIGPAAGMDFNAVPEVISASRAVWSPTLSTLLIIVALVFGWIVYAFGTVIKQRSTTTFVGGEIFDDELVRFPGTGFYRTVSDIPVLSTLYEDAEKGVYDLYVLFGAYGQKFVSVLRAIHNGVVSTYVAFALIGLSFLIFVLLM